MAYLFDTTAISELFKRRPNSEFVDWLRSLPRQEQFTSIVVVGELYVAAYRSKAREEWLRRIREEVLPRLTVLEFDAKCAEEYGRLRAHLADLGTPIGDTDAQIAATARHHRLTIVTANVKHFQRVPDLPLKTFISGAGR